MCVCVCVWSTHHIKDSTCHYVYKFKKYDHREITKLAKVLFLLLQLYFDDSVKECVLFSFFFGGGSW